MQDKRYIRSALQMMWITKH